MILHSNQNYTYGVAKAIGLATVVDNGFQVSNPLLLFGEVECHQVEAARGFI